MLKSVATSFLKEEEGQDLVEYTLLLAFIALAAVTQLSTIKTAISGIFDKVNTHLTNANSQAQ